MAHPSAIDPPGICLLKSIENIFCGLSENWPNYQVHEINTVAKLKHHFTNNQPVSTGICPAIIACQFSNPPIAHAMVATGIDRKIVNNIHVDFVQCKNSYRDDPSQPG